MSYIRVARDSTRRKRSKSWVGNHLGSCSMCICRAKSWVVALHSRHEASRKKRGKISTWESCEGTGSEYS